LASQRDIHTSGLVVVSGPSFEPVTIAEAKLHLRIDGTADDSWLTDTIGVARLWLERAYNVSFVDQTFDWSMDSFPDDVIEVPRPPLDSITSIKYTDAAGVVQTLATDQYDVDVNSRPGRILPAFGKFWPSTQSVPGAVVIRFKAGYGSSAAGVPLDLKHAVYLLVGHWYRNREAVLTGVTSKSIEFAVDALMSANSVPVIA